MINDEKYYFEGYLSIMSLKGVRKKDNPDYVQRKNVNGNAYYKKIEDPHKNTTATSNIDDYNALLDYEFSNEDYEIIDHIEYENEDDYNKNNSMEDTTEIETYSDDDSEEYYDTPYDNDQDYYDEYDNQDYYPESFDDYQEDNRFNKVTNIKQNVINFFDKYKYPIIIGTGAVLTIGAVGVGIFAFTNFIVVS